MTVTITVTYAGHDPKGLSIVGRINELYRNVPQEDQIQLSTGYYPEYRALGASMLAFYTEREREWGGIFYVKIIYEDRIIDLMYYFEREGPPQSWGVKHAR